MRGIAVVFEDQNQVLVRDVDIPDPTSQDVVIDVKYSWISVGTESSFLRGERISGEQVYKPGDGKPFPNVAGYQKVGIVRSVGDDVTGISVGDKVFASVSKVSNMFFDIAGHISPAVTHFTQVWKLPDDACLEDYAGVVLTQVGLNCGMRPQLQPRDLAVVIGDGLVGQWAAQTLLHRGANVIVLGRHNEKLTYLPDGISGFNTKVKPLHSVISQIGEVNIVVDSVGDMDTVGVIQPHMIRNSHLVSAGFLGDCGMIDIQKLRNQEITLHTPSGWTRERIDQTLLGISEGWLVTSPLITHRFSVMHAVEAWDLIRVNKAQTLGVVLEW